MVIKYRYYVSSNSNFFAKKQDIPIGAPPEMLKSLEEPQKSLKNLEEPWRTLKNVEESLTIFQAHGKCLKALKILEKSWKILMPFLKSIPRDFYGQLNGG